MRKIMIYLLIACFAVLINACSKAKKNERWLKKGAGEWQSVTLKSQNQETAIIYPFMKYIFDETGTFARIIYTDPEQTIITSEEGGKWFCEKDAILIEYSSGWKEKLKILHIEKKKMELEIKDGSSSTDILSLEKID